MTVSYPDSIHSLPRFPSIISALFEVADFREHETCINVFNNIISTSNFPQAMMSIVSLSDRLHISTYKLPDRHKRSCDSLLMVQNKLGHAWVGCAEKLVQTQNVSLAIELARQAANYSQDFGPVNKEIRSWWQKTVVSIHPKDSASAEGYLVAAHALMDPYAISFRSTVRDTAAQLGISDLNQLASRRSAKTVFIPFKPKEFDA